MAGSQVQSLYCPPIPAKIPPSFRGGPVPMRLLFHCLIALTAISWSASALANAGTTSAGVVTTDPNAPSTEVQQQSSGFVAANQQAQNTAASGITLPNGVAGGGITQSGQAGAGNPDAKNAPSGQSGAQGAAAEHAAPAAPATPPPPPPTYESKMRPVGQEAANTAGPAPAPVRPAAPALRMQAPTQAPAKAPEPAAKTPATPVANQNHAAPATKQNDEPATAAPADPGGGRGAAPDDYTFWFGLLIAGALLALAAVTWLRIRRGETAR